MAFLLGKQSDGRSNSDIYAMSRQALERLPLPWEEVTALDIGAGAGLFTRYLSRRCRKVYALDSSLPRACEENTAICTTDLNERWPLEEACVDIAVAIEVIEHLENPRHFFREARRVLKDGGYLWLTTPNNLSLFSRLLFLFKGQHRAFQDFSYPAHITPVLQTDLRRIAKENDLMLLGFRYSNADALPLLHTRVRIGGALFSANFGALFRKQ